jgi:hypothetical protein
MEQRTRQDQQEGRDPVHAAAASSSQRNASRVEAWPVERVDPFDLGDEVTSGAAAPAVDIPQLQLAELRARIHELDAKVAGLLARREELTRAAFEVATRASTMASANSV